MRFLFVASLLTLPMFSAMAAQCDVEFNGKLQLENQQLTITTEHNKQLVINPSNQLLVNGRSLALNAQQQKLVSDYYGGIYAVAPQAAGIAKDAIKLAGVTVNEVFSELLGPDNDAIEDLTTQFTDLSQHIDSNFYSENGDIRFNSDNFNDGNFLGERWEDEFEQNVEELVAKSVGKIMLAVGSQLLFNGGDMDAFETKMDNFSQDIEQRVEFQSKGIEARADALCNSLLEVDQIETQLQQSIPELADLNVLQVKANNQAM